MSLQGMGTVSANQLENGNQYAATGGANLGIAQNAAALHNLASE